MSLKVLDTIVPDSFPFGFNNEEGIRHCIRSFNFKATCDIDGDIGNLVFIFDMLCPYNGASNPFNWPIKNYYDNPKKDCCGLGHDALYAWGGEVSGLGRVLDSGECDDFIRGAMREAGFSRKEAGIVDWVVRHLAHFLHFGKKNDKENMHSYCTIRWVPEVIE